MKINRREYQANDFIGIRDFLKKTYKTVPLQRNWFIDRWNFCRYFAHPIYDTFDSWPNTVGLWIDENESIVSIVNSEGECRGEAFFQFGVDNYPEELIDEMIIFAEKTLNVNEGNERYINLRVNEDSYVIKDKLKNRNYSPEDWKEITCSMGLSKDCIATLPDGFTVANANEVSMEKRIKAHVLAFNSNDPENVEWKMKREKAYKSLKNAPDYKPELDLAIIDKHGEIASFSTVWYDDDNRIGILEPVGTIPNYRLMGLGKAVIYEGINRIKKLGAKKMYVGSDQQFYHSIGFSVAFKKEVWQKRWRA